MEASISRCSQSQAQLENRQTKRDEAKYVEPLADDLLAFGVVKIAHDLHHVQDVGDYGDVDEEKFGQVLQCDLSFRYEPARQNDYQEKDVKNYVFDQVLG